MTGRNTKMGSFKKGEDAVSPVIGVILMVAITVILAAVIGAFVFGMGGSVSKTYTVGVTAAQTGSNTVDVTFQGGPDADVVHYINVSIGGAEFRGTAINDGATDGGTAYPALGDPVTDPAVTLPVGTSVTLTDSGDSISAERDHLIATATFRDGSKQVILDTYV